jgi:hypothetical protein
MATISDIRYNGLGSASAEATWNRPDQKEGKTWERIINHHRT